MNFIDLSVGDLLINRDTKRVAKVIKLEDKYRTVYIKLESGRTTVLSAGSLARWKTY